MGRIFPIYNYEPINIKIMSNNFLQLANELGWSYNISEAPNKGEVCAELEKYSPQGQDFIASIWFENSNEYDFIDRLREYWQDYDPDEEAAKWIGEDGHGANGAPYSVRDIIDDMEECKGMLRELYIAFHNRAFPDRKVGDYDRGLTLDNNEDYHLSADEHYAVYNILTSIDNVHTYASYLPSYCGYDNLRQEIEEMADRFKEQVRNKMERSFLNR